MLAGYWSARSRPGPWMHACWNGRPRRSEYRTFKMKSVEGQDDFAAMAEMTGRYLRRRLDEGKPLPDLVLVDGGRGQLNAAMGAAHDRAEPLRLSRRSPSLRLLQRIRDEAHRVAVTFNRKRRTVRALGSELLRIPGVGPSRRRALLERFGSLAGVRSASLEEIASVPGISRHLSERILDHLQQKS